MVADPDNGRDDPVGEEPALVRVTRPDYKRVRCGPSSLVAELCRAKSQGHQAWNSAQ